MSNQIVLLSIDNELCPMLIDSLNKQGVSRDTSKLQRLLLYSSLFNLLLVSLLGVLLRGFPFLNNIGLSYKNVLHGHSHFAFGGWLMPAVLLVLLRCFPQIEKAVAYHHWRNIALLLLISAYGMLIAFPLQGYKAISICFSTLSIIAGYYLAVVIRKALRKLQSSTSLRFLQWGLFYFVLSSLGPFATGPLIVMGETGSSLYHDVIYFYLHFQYNGWFLFVVLSLLYKYLESKGVKNKGAKVFRLLNYTCLPTYFLSVLWHQPLVVFNFIGGVAALVQLFAAWWLVKDVSNCPFQSKQVKQLLIVVLSAFVLKLVLQVISSLPAVALMAYHYRNFVIAYLHLVLLGCISLFLIIWITYSFKVEMTKLIQTGLALFLVAFIISELLIIASPVAAMVNFSFPYYAISLLMVSIFLPIAIGMFGWAITNQIDATSKPVPILNFKLTSS